MAVPASASTPPRLAPRSMDDGTEDAAAPVLRPWLVRPARNPPALLPALEMCDERSKVNVVELEVEVGDPFDEEVSNCSTELSGETQESLISEREMRSPWICAGDPTKLLDPASQALNSFPVLSSCPAATARSIGDLPIASTTSRFACPHTSSNAHVNLQSPNAA
jgi:hypothetical protein